MTRLTTLLVGLGALALAPMALAGDGLVKQASPYSVDETAERFVDNARDKGLKIFERVDHAAGAARVDMALRPTRVVIFGNPKGGTPLMQCAQTIGIDLPMKALIWQDAEGQVWLGYNSPDYLAQRHSAGNCKPIVKISRVLSELADTTVAAAE